MSFISKLRSTIKVCAGALGVTIERVAGRAFTRTDGCSFEHAAIATLCIRGRRVGSISAWLSGCWDAYAYGPKKWDAYIKYQQERVFIGYSDGSPYSTSIMIGDARSINCQMGGWEPKFIERRIGNVLISGSTMTATRRAARAKYPDGRSPYEKIVAGLGPN